MTLTKTTPRLLSSMSLLCGLALGIGCATQTSVNPASEYPHTGTPPGTDTRVSALAADTYEMVDGKVVAPDFMYDYAFDYDDDGSYAAGSPSPVTTEPTPPTKYAYAYDRDDDGSYAKPRVDTTTVPAYVPRLTPITSIPFVIHEDLLDRCADADREFYFAFDSAKLPADIDADMANLVTCLQDPRLQTQKIEIIGYTDERGSAAYNAQLGLERAQSVADALESKGLADDRIHVRSAGEAEADDPLYWDDRRVIIRLE